MHNIKIFVATHKRYDFPNLDLYIPIQVGCELRKEDFGYARDNECMDTISHKNASFCELTALYELWKNEKYSTLEYIGLSHYRRYFQGHEFDFKGMKIINEKELITLLNDYDLIVPKKYTINQKIEKNVYEQYSNAHYEADLIELREVFKEHYPQYIKSFDTVMNSKTLYLFNMFVMKKTDFDRYMQWLFDILFILEKRIDISEYDNYQYRVFGFLSERLWNIWLDSQDLSYVEVEVVNIENNDLTLQDNRNIILKITEFLRKKIF